jgi:hypothetical protein
LLFACRHRNPRQSDRRLGQARTDRYCSTPAGSILAVGLLHAAFNASGNLSAVYGAWQPLLALVPLTLGMYVYRAIRDRRRRPAVPAWPT